MRITEHSIPEHQFLMSKNDLCNAEHSLQVEKEGIKELSCNTLSHSIIFA